MTFSYARERPGVRAEILERLAAGKRLKAICREPGMPCPESVTGWMRRDAAFAAEVARARAQGDWRRRLAFDDARAEALVARLRAGERLADILRDPAMPSLATYRYWRATQSRFAEQLHHVAEAREAIRRTKARERRRPFDPAVAERLYRRLWAGEPLRAVLRSDRAFPSLMVFARWRREEPGFDAMMRFVLAGWKRRRGRARGLCTPELTAAIVALIRQGHSLRSLARLPGMPSQKAMYNWVRQRPDFAEAVEAACVDREDWYHDQILDVLERAPPTSGRKLQRLIGPLSAQEMRLRKRPGWKRRRAAAAARPHPEAWGGRPCQSPKAEFMGGADKPGHDGL